MSGESSSEMRLTVAMRRAPEGGPGARPPGRSGGGGVLDALMLGGDPEMVLGKGNEQIELPPRTGDSGAACLGLPSYTDQCKIIP